MFTPYTDLKSALLLVAIISAAWIERVILPCARVQMRAIGYEELGGIYDLVERPPP
ncbi:MAG: hypothetical protein OXE59_06785 [Bacteroidetes bacterium]|nr:hypothetical protein [Bacteroidota bacterium]MCY4233426.1 hypothetical protein [Bacteroidota bacterium]